MRLSPEEQERQSAVDAEPVDQNPVAAETVQEQRTGVMAFLARVWERAANGDPARRREAELQIQSRDRTRTVVALGGTAVVVSIVLLGMFSSEREKVVRTRPNLGRPLPQPGETNPGSIAPLMNAQPQTEEPDSDLDPADIANTARPRQKGEPAPAEKTLPRNYTLGQIPPSDPALDEAYWREQIQKRAPPLAPPVPANPNAAALRAERELESLRKASLVFVRQTESADRAPRVTPVNVVEPAFESTREAYLPVGTKLVARLQNAVTSAVKTPAIATIEYHYERDGEIVVPAGTRAIGELTQANAQGTVSLRFHTLEFAGGSQVRVDATAVSLDHGPLKGQVSGGSNRAKRVLARTLTGIGSMAAFVVGGGRYRLGGPIDNTVFLRERIAQNVGMAGEQELMAMGYGQDTVVTIPGNVRFYLAIQKPAGEIAAAPGRAPVPRTVPNLQFANAYGESPLPTAAELRELAALKQELANLYARVPVAKTVDTGPVR